MSSRPTEHPHVSATIAGLGLATQIAVAATDGVPIVKQVLGVLSHIVKLAEDIEKRRDALYQLAETARKLRKKLLAVTAGRTLGGEIMVSLEELRDVLCSIETLLEKHRAKKPFHNALSYMFTTAKRIETLTQDLSRATDDFLLVAAIDTNVRVQDNAQYIGNFRLIRDCDVKNLVLLTEHQDFWSRYRTRVYSAEVDGSVCILRCFAGPEGEPGYGWHRREVVEHDKLLEKLSKVKNLHPNIARLYGRNAGEHFDRFNVMNSGYVPAIGAPERTATPDWSWNIIRQIVSGRLMPSQGLRRFLGA